MLCGWVAGQRVPVLAAVGRCVWEGWTSCAILLMAWGHSASDTSAAATCFRWQADCMVVRQHKAGPRQYVLQSEAPAKQVFIPLETPCLPALPPEVLQTADSGMQQN